MAIAIKQAGAQSLAQCLSEGIHKVRCFFSDETETNFISCSNNVEFDEENNCYYCNVSFSISVSETKTIIKINFYDENETLLFEDNGTLEIFLNEGDNYITKKLKISYQT